MWSAASVLLTVFVVGCNELLGPMKRPATKDAAAFVEANALPEDAIGEVSVFG
jgi:hypothetical protein